MSWLGERQDELSRAKAAKTDLESQVQCHLRWKKEREHEIQKLSARIHKCTKLRHQIYLRLNDAQDRRWNLEYELEDAERAIKLNTELVERENYMDLQKFPKEIFNMILELVLRENDRIKLLDQSPDQLHLGIFGTCKELKEAAEKVFYKHITFEVSSANINERRSTYYDPICWPDAPPRWLMQHLKLHIDEKTDIPRLLKLLEGCKALESLVLIIESVPKNYARTLRSVRYQRPSKIDMVGVGISPGQKHPKKLQEARTMLLDVLWDTILPTDVKHFNFPFIYYTRGEITPLTLATIAG